MTARPSSSSGMSSKPRHRKVAVCGSAGFPITAEIGAEIVEILRDLPAGSAILTRGRGNIDQFVSHVAPLLGLRCFTYPSAGGRDNWQRDVELVKDADEVIAFLASATLGDANTGTAHLIEKALDQRKRVRAFSEVDNHLVYAGATD